MTKKAKRIAKPKTASLKKSKPTIDAHIRASEGKPSASRFDSDFRCLGKRALEMQLPPEPDNVNTRRGSKIHKALELSDLSGLSRSDRITAERCMYAEGELVHKYGFEGAKVTFEERIFDVDENLQPIWSAGLDTLYLQKGRALLIDYKTGFMATQPIERNWQIKGQIAAVRIKYQVDEITAGLVHPHHPDSLYEDIQANGRRADMHAETIRGTIVQIGEDAQPRTPNSISCSYCRARRICPEYQHRIDSVAKAVKEEAKDEGYSKLIERTPEERGKHIKSLFMLKSSLDTVMEQYAKLIKSGDEAAGWNLQNSWNVTVKDELAAMSMIRTAWGEAALSAAMKIDLKALTAHVAQKEGLQTKQAKEQIDATLKPLLKYTIKKATLTETVI